MRYLANNCVKALLLSRHVRVSTLGVFTKGLFLVLHPNIAFLQDVQNYVKLVIHRFSALSKMCYLAYNCVRVPSPNSHVRQSTLLSVDRHSFLFFIQILRFCKTCKITSNLLSIDLVHFRKCAIWRIICCRYSVFPKITL